MRMEVRRWSKLMSLNGNARPCQPMSNRKVTLCSTDHQQHCNSCPIWLLSKQLCQPRKFGHEVIREHTQAIYFELGPLSAYIYIWLYDERKFRRESSYELPLAPKPWKHSTGRNSLVSFKNRQPRQKVSKSSNKSAAKNPCQFDGDLAFSMFGPLGPNFQEHEYLSLHTLFYWKLLTHALFVRQLLAPARKK